jgi:CheY-like chemotaxis protein
MIYLFDDKINRQLDYGWNEEKFLKYSSNIVPIPLYSTIQNEQTKSEIFAQGNIILFHESFFDNTLNKHKDASEIRNKLNQAQVTRDFKVVYFSGSKNSRKFDDNIGHIPVSILYQNLEVFLNKIEIGTTDLKHLFFGENYQIEELLVDKLEAANRDIENSIENPNPNSENFIALTTKNDIETIFENACYETFYLEEDHNFQITDDYLSQKVKEWFSEKEYDNIFIPICFGPILSDFNGLRFALHLRCTITPNQLKNIYLYSFITIDHLVHHKYFDILKTKNVQLINYSKIAFSEALQLSSNNLGKEELKKDITKVKLDPPKNYEDNHSIANEWAIFRWASAIQANDSDIEKITRKIHNQLYFKYLSTIYPVKDISPIDPARLEINYTGSPKILYIDDEADKGWYEVFCKILCDINELDLNYLDGELHNLSRESIIKKSLETIELENIDIVLLDFRLHADDFETKNIQDVTGLQILKAIKKHNPGIQVVIFSATNKVWNLKSIQDAGADGFIVKEGPENSIDPDFITLTIESMINIIAKKTEVIFLKQFYINYYDLEKELLPRKKYKKVTNPLPKEFVDEVLKWFKLSIDILKDGDITDSKRTSSFLFLFSVLENLSNRVINVDNPIISEIENERREFSFEFRGKNIKLKHFTEDRDSPGYYRKTQYEMKCKRSIPWHLKILNTLDYITNESVNGKELSYIIKKRNDFIHSNSTTGDNFDIKVNDIIWLHNIIYNALKNIN